MAYAKILSDDKGLEALVVGQLKKVFDPEIPLDVLGLGLIYHVEIVIKKVSVLMTLTNPACPSGAAIVQTVELAISDLKEVETVDVELTFDPPYTFETMSEAGKLELGFL
ncbi:metal-sulfur cluster biosynthetic enzyme [Catalinimonas alkaloidigena]|uniref:iron-sulfur cluster assembly protein n=1 Tax=Catalinimonas alkaloidigena TaxID=1075417 RepID=UPI0024054DAD|nr:iron-sulfur cluster assembly protein [Catalinimonas alkaloidigena]MDF9801359.1 metal-sulfur cluster biosynthetic enzyme [Catalinimonas alkaloidigena]